MLTAGRIQTLCDEGKLFHVESLRWRAPEVRQIHVSADIHRFLETESDDPGTNRDRKKLQALFDAFIAGDSISATLEETVMRTDLKRLSPGSNEVWEFKIGKKKFIQWRVFGRFAEFNHFVALTGPSDRTNIDIAEQIVTCQDKWRTLFGYLPPLSGSDIDDYFSAAPISLTDP